MTKTSYYKVIRSIIRKDGLSGFYRGFTVSLLRIVPQYGMHFYTYNKLINAFQQLTPDNRKNKLTYVRDQIIAGGLAGQIGWLVTYPLDAVKNFVQYHPNYKSWTKATRFLYRKYGWSYFYRGYSIAVLRAFPVSAVSFIVYDYMFHKLQDL